jgi:hypothetical protein
MCADPNFSFPMVVCLIHMLQNAGRRQEELEGYSSFGGESNIASLSLSKQHARSNTVESWHGDLTADPDDGNSNNSTATTTSAAKL